MRSRSLALVLAVAVAAVCVPAELHAQGRGGAPTGPPPSIEDKTAGMQRMDGFFPMYWDAAAGQLWLEIPAMGEELLYITGLSAGVGSNDIGLDRGQGRGGRIVHFERVGPKVLMVQPNTAFRAVSDNADERRAVEEAFAKSILWGFTVAAESEGRVLVDLTDFLMRDEHGVAARLRPAQFRLDTSRSALFMERTRNFPDNTEMDVTLTFVATDPIGGGGFGGGGTQRGPGGGFGRGALWVVTPTPSASTTRWCGCPGRATNRAPSTRAPVCSTSATRTTRRRSARRSPSDCCRGIACRRRIRALPSARRSSRSSTTWTAARRSPSAPPSWKARRGGTRPSRPPVTRTPSR